MNTLALQAAAGAAPLADFPDPHRVLQSGGIIPSGWHPVASDAPDPEESRRLLKRDGVRFDERGRASRDDYIAWDALVEFDQRPSQGA